jgi:regulatory protein
MSEPTDRPRRPKAPPPTPFELAVRFLKLRDRSERELRIKLRQKGVEAGAIDEAVEKVRRLGYLDEARMAHARAESLISRGKLGPRGVAARLGRAGVDRAEVQAAVKGALNRHDELEIVRALVRKRHPDAVGSRDPKVRARAVRFLLGRGFSPGVVSKALEVEIDPVDEGGEP